jgi:transcriptional regulator with XRE-family HTH domain
MTQNDLPLRAARATRGWSQSKAAQELAGLAAARGIPVAAPVSLKTQLSRWENQHAQPEEHYRDLLCALYESSEAELGLVEPDDGDSRGSDDLRLRSALAGSTALDRDTIALLRAQLDATHRLDDRMGTAAAAGTARAQLDHLHRAHAHCTDRAVRADAAGLLFDAALLAGRHARDQLQPALAWQDLETARAAGHELGSPPMVSRSLLEQASLLRDIGEPEAGARLAGQAAESAGTGLSGRFEAWLEAAQGEALAADGQPEPARSAYRRAEQRLLGSATVDIAFPEAFGLVFDLPDLRRHRGHSELLLHENEQAIDDLTSSLDEELPVRDLAAVHVDLAYAHEAAGSPARAAEHAGRARELVTRIGSTRLARRLDERAGDPLTGS